MRVLGSATTAGDLSALPVAVQIVLHPGPEEQVIRSDTRRVIAAVKYTQPIGDGAVVETPRDSVGRLLAKRSTGTRSKDSVAEVGSHPGPFPAAVRLADLGPEAFLLAPHRLVRSTATNRTEPLAAFVANRSDNLRSASLAGVAKHRRWHAPILPKAVVA